MFSFTPSTFERNNNYLKWERIKASSAIFGLSLDLQELLQHYSDGRFSLSKNKNIGVLTCDVWRIPLWEPSRSHCTSPRWIFWTHTRILIHDWGENLRIQFKIHESNSVLVIVNVLTFSHFHWSFHFRNLTKQNQAWLLDGACQFMTLRHLKLLTESKE